MNSDKSKNASGNGLYEYIGEEKNLMMKKKLQ